MVSLPTTEDPILQEPSSVLLHQRSQGAFLHVGGFGWPGCEPRTGSCCCSCCSSAITVGEARWSGSPRTASVPDSSATLSQRLPTAPLHCLPVPPDSSATLSAGASRQLLYTVCRCLQTAPLHCLPVPPDSSTTLSPGRCVTLLLPILLASARFVGEWGGE